jgi:hypothetical protein
MDERTPHYPLANIPERIFRLSRTLDPREFTPWRYIAANAPGRLDDPERKYRVLYFADSHLTAMLEVLAGALAPASLRSAERAAIENDDQ